MARNVLGVHDINDHEITACNTDHVQADQMNSNQSSAQQLYNTMTLAMYMYMPKQELVDFDGEPMKYWN